MRTEVGFDLLDLLRLDLGAAAVAAGAGLARLAFGGLCPSLVPVDRFLRLARGPSFRRSTGLLGRFLSPGAICPARRLRLRCCSALCAGSAWPSSCRAAGLRGGRPTPRAGGTSTFHCTTGRWACGGATPIGSSLRQSRG